MLFNSYVFIFLFLPITIAGFFHIARTASRRAAFVWLVGCSLAFYGWWNPIHVLLLTSSVLFNFTLGTYLASAGRSRPYSKLVLAFGVTGNLATLGYFKYANFFVDSANSIFGSSLHLDAIVLPLAISFFTFQQIAYLVDAYRGETSEHSFTDYCLFVTFFPQLIAGPIVHHKEMLPQFTSRRIGRLSSSNLFVGITIFVLGLCKKVLFADQIAVHANCVFDAAHFGVRPTFAEAWMGTLAYSLQLYFDFSGYSDMAIGLGRIFGINLPVNFNSPYKAANIIEFWRRWHMTLSRFLRDYLYIALGGSRKGKVRRYLNLMITMLLGGLWHGAGWTFVFWGGLHGLYLVVNHSWHRLRSTIGFPSGRSHLIGRAAARLTTFSAVAVAWVFFRASSFSAALVMLKSMCGLYGFNTHVSLSQKPEEAWMAIAVLLAMVWFAPNTEQFVRRYRRAVRMGLNLDQIEPAPAYFGWLLWRPTAFRAVLLGVLTVASVLYLTQVNEFIYFQF